MAAKKSKLIQNTLSAISNIVSGLVKKQSKLVVFGADNGQLYADNSRHLFEWILNYRKDIHPVWLTRNPKVINELKQKSLPVAQIRSWRGIKYLAQAKVGVYTSSLRDLAFNPFWVPNSVHLVALRHGKSVKRVRFARLNDKISDHEYQERLRESSLISYAISTSDFISEIQEECLRLGIQKQKVTGYPRNDMLFTKSQEMESAWEIFLEGLHPNMVVLYGPSWRHGRKATRFFPFPDFNKSEISEFLIENNILILLRPHINELIACQELNAFLLDLEKSCPNIRLATHNEFPDVNLLLPFVDVLISDYSSLYHDYLLLDRPLIFIPYDYEDYEKKNGFLYDYFKYLPGPAIYKQKELLLHIASISRGEDLYFEKRKELRNTIHFYQDANSCKRVTDLIIDMLEEIEQRVIKKFIQNRISKTLIKVAC